MWRIVLEFLALFLAPTLFYLAWTILIRKSKPTVVAALRGSTLVQLFFVGCAVVFLGLLLARSREEAPAGSTYEPPTYKDGKITPGRIK
jgi:hypothetical protein